MTYRHIAERGFINFIFIYINGGTEYSDKCGRYALNVEIDRRI